MIVTKKFIPKFIIGFCLLLAMVIPSFSNTLSSKGRRDRGPTQSEAREAEQRLAEMGYWTGRIDGTVDSSTRAALIAFQKLEGRRITGRLTRDEVEAIRNATPPQPRDTGYRHVEVDLDRQVFMLINEQGVVEKILPVSTGSGKHYNEKGMRGIAYTPRGRFRVYGKAMGWKRSPLGLLYYPNYISGGVAIHGNPAVPNEPQSHGCIRIPMFASRDVSRLLPIGSIVLVYDSASFVSARDWAEEDRVKRIATAQ